MAKISDLRTAEIAEALGLTMYAAWGLRKAWDAAARKRGGNANNAVWMAAQCYWDGDPFRLMAVMSGQTQPLFEQKLAQNCEKSARKVDENCEKSARKVDENETVSPSIPPTPPFKPQEEEEKSRKTEQKPTAPAPEQKEENEDSLRSSSSSSGGMRKKQETRQSFAKNKAAWQTLRGIWNQLRPPELAMVESATMEDLQQAGTAWQSKPSPRWWQNTMRLLQTSRYCRGYGPTEWQATFTWWLRKGAIGLDNGEFQFCVERERAPADLKPMNGELAQLESRTTRGSHAVVKTRWYATIRWLGTRGATIWGAAPNDENKRSAELEMHRLEALMSAIFKEKMLVRIVVEDRCAAPEEVTLKGVENGVGIHETQGKSGESGGAGGAGSSTSGAGGAGHAVGGAPEAGAGGGGRPVPCGGVCAGAEAGATSAGGGEGVCGAGGRE